VGNEKLGSDLVSDYALEYLGSMFPDKHACLNRPPIERYSVGATQLRSLSITLNNDITKRLPSSLEETDESYSISILEDGEEISLKANQYSGVVRGLSTIH
jgi:hexosaminidase